MRRHYSFIIAALLVLVILVWITVDTPPDPRQILLWLLFAALILFTNAFGVRLAGGAVSLLPMATVASYLVLGPAPTGWAAFGGTVIYGALRYRWAAQLGSARSTNRLATIGLNAANATMHTSSILAGGALYQALNGEIPLQSSGVSFLGPLIVLGFTYLVINYLIAGIYIATRGQAALQDYIQSLPNLLFYEGAPLIFAPLVALIYTQLGLLQFILFAILLVAASLITRSLAHTSRRLERRVKELDSLQAVGQALSASLSLDTILLAIHTQVSALMRARNFYVALYDPETQEVSFPLAFEDGERVEWRTRSAGRGLTEHILQTGKPLLIERDVPQALEEIGLDQIGRAAASWLGVPILAENESLGVIAIQSFTKPNAYDTSHQEILVTIAAQAAVAIQNARLYERTDEALARRVQELGSILRTTNEGILLLDLNWRTVTSNRAMADFLGIPQNELTGQPLDTPLKKGQTLMMMLGYTPESLAEVSHEEAHKQIIPVPGPPERQVERTLTPVHDQGGATVGWLLVLHDITEEMELARLREDLTHMLVHDLRSPLTVLRGSLEMMADSIQDADAKSLLVMARRGSDRMLRMVSELLDISKLESGQMIIHPEMVSAADLIKDIVIRISPLAREVHITIETSAPPDLPPLYVDIGFISRVLNNLVDNAIKFTPDGGHVRMWARLDDQTTPQTILLGVSDTGPGIPEEERGRLFDKFQQISSINGRRAGTGLGLPFCKLAVEDHGGEIWVESEVGQGSTFVLRLPVAPDDA